MNFYPPPPVDPPIVKRTSSNLAFFIFCLFVFARISLKSFLFFFSTMLPFVACRLYKKALLIPLFFISFFIL